MPSSIEQRVLARGRREPEGDVLQHLDQHAAETEGDELAERRVGDRADDHLLAAAAASAAPARRGSRRSGRTCGRCRRSWRRPARACSDDVDADEHAAGLGLVQDVRRDDLHDDREADVVRRAAPRPRRSWPALLAGPRCRRPRTRLALRARSAPAACGARLRRAVVRTVLLSCAMWSPRATQITFSDCSAAISAAPRPSSASTSLRCARRAAASAAPRWGCRTA